MAVDLMGFSKTTDQEHMAVQEAAAAGLRSLERLVFHLSSNQNNPSADCREITDITVSNFKRVISILDRSGHARFRRAPAAPPPPPQIPLLQVPLSQIPYAAPPAPQQTLTLDFTKPNTTDIAAAPAAQSPFAKECFSISMSSANSSSFLSSVTADGSVSNGKHQQLNPAATAGASAGKPPLSGNKRCHSHAHSEDLKSKSAAASGGRCHCSKRRKLRVKNTIRVPAISSKMAAIPSDEYSWRKYGQKPIKGSPYPRGYYKCSSLRGCPARKHVERDPDEPSMLIVTYEGDHRHTPAAAVATAVSDGVMLDRPCDT